MSYGAKGGKTVGGLQTKASKIVKTKVGKSDGSSYSASYSASMRSNPYNYGGVGAAAAVAATAKASKRE